MNIKKFFENKEQKNIVNQENKKAVVKNNHFFNFKGLKIFGDFEVFKVLNKIGKALAPERKTQAVTRFDEKNCELFIAGKEYRLGSDGRLECYDKTLRNKNIEILPLIH